MSKAGPIIIIEDDVDDRELLEEVIRELQISTELVWFDLCDKAFDYLKTTAKQPFIIFCDVSLPKQTGMEFKKQIDNDKQLRKKSIPFIFYSTAINQETINEAYTEMTVQGYFQKGTNLMEIKRDIEIIIEYWKRCKHPNTF